MRRSTFSAGAVLVAAGVAAWLAFGVRPLGAPAVTATPRGRPDILLVTIDTLRADRCSLYGAERATTPFLVELARRAVVFDAATSTSSWTPPSMASIFTGLPPRAHGVLHGTIRNGAAVNQERLDEALVTLAEAFSAAGYRSVGVSSNAHLVAATGFAQGFRDLRALEWKDAGLVNAAAKELATTRRAGEPLFLWVHYFDPHAPYQARAPFIDRSGVAAAHWQPYAGVEEKVLRLARRDVQDPAVLRRAVTALYDSEVAATDAALRQLYRDLGVDSSWLVAITSDHGEALHEHGQFGHGGSLYQEQVHVPPLVAGPGAGVPRRIAAPVSNADLFVTLLDLAHLPRPPGLDCPGLLAGADPDAPVALELNRAGFDHVALRRGRLKLYRRIAPRPFVELFDLAADPREMRNLARTDRVALASVTAALDRWLAAWPRRTAATPVTDPLDPESIERLKSLGYVDAGGGG